MTLTAFGKIGKIKILQSKIQRTQIDILYKKITQAGSAGMMDLELFFSALEELANQLFPLELSKFDALVDIIIENLDDLKPTKLATKGKPRKNTAM